ncbi:DUF4116 domain-containing protein [Ramlibacter sp. H39-3-26]|uniref:DUF4116 domain-containing protein n=1 Tax=Curvibacter soli TaxID=3031331 RepID=UPI0023D991B2|nr:DUF4116 domain-containing protein [Ramlibacter sp. H39-3-26]MDF1486178.1 DUF4116 domain-containing protein [Ramlibacter sp. H39-3-26]
MPINATIRKIINEKCLDPNTPELALDDINVALTVAQHCPQDFIHLSERLRADKALLSLVLQNIPYSIHPEGPQPIELASDALKDDEEVAALSIKKNPCSIQWLSNRLKNNDDLAKIAMNSSPLAYPGLSLRLREKDDYIESYVLAVENCGLYCQCAEDYLPKELKKHVDEFGFSTRIVQAWLLNRKLSRDLEVKSNYPYKKRKLPV